MKTLRDFAPSLRRWNPVMVRTGAREEVANGKKKAGVSLGCPSVCESQQDKTNRFVNEISRKLIIHPFQCHRFRHSRTAGGHKLYFSFNLFPVNNRKHLRCVRRGGTWGLQLLSAPALAVMDRRRYSLSCHPPPDKIARGLWIRTGRSSVCHCLKYNI